MEYRVSYLERCFPEILLVIFAFACMDPGRTGRSLSLVSQCISDVVKRVLLQSVGLYNIKQIDAFIAYLTSRDPHERIVRHLFITLHKGPGITERYSNERSSLLHLFEMISLNLQTLAVSLPFWNFRINLDFDEGKDLEDQSAYPLFPFTFLD